MRSIERGRAAHSPNSGLSLPGVTVVVICAGFALWALSRIDTTSLWSDELMTIHKAFLPSLSDLLQYLRQDTHPPVYYVLLWLGARAGMPATAVAFRLVSWCAYVLGGLAMVALAWDLARRDNEARPGVAAAAAALLAFCTPFPLRFAIEAKGYSLLVLFLTLGLWGRQRCLSPSAGRAAWMVLPLGLALAASTHYYGLFFLAALILVDASLALASPSSGRGRLRVVGAELLATLPVGLWILGSLRPLAEGSSLEWLGPPTTYLLTDTLRRYLGPSPWPKLAAGGLILLLMLGFGLLRRADRGEGGGGAGLLRRLDGSGLLAGVAMVVLVVGVSLLGKPLAFSRYFFVLLPCLVAWIALECALFRADRRGRWLLSGLLLLALISSFSDASRLLAPVGAKQGSRESTNYRALSLATAGQPLRYTPKVPQRLEISDQALIASGRLAAEAATPWRRGRVLLERLEGPAGERPERFVLADSGSRRRLRKGLEPLRRRVEAEGYRCEELLPDTAYVSALLCRAR